MRRVLMVMLLAVMVSLGTFNLVGASTARPTNVVFPFRTSSYATAMTAARAFGVLIGFERKDRYVKSGDVISVSTTSSKLESYFHLEMAGGYWYVTSVTTPNIDVTAPTVNSRVGTLIKVRALALSSAHYLATMQVNDSKLTPGGYLKKSAVHYEGRATSIGPNIQVGIYTGKIAFTPRPDQWGYVLVLATDPIGDALAAETIRISN